MNFSENKGSKMGAWHLQFVEIEKKDAFDRVSIRWTFFFAT
jgi:hypothetical protein